MGPSKEEYYIERTLGEKPVISKNGKVIAITTLEGIVSYLYFGQKDLSEIGEDQFNVDLMNKFFGEKLLDTRRKIEEERNRIISLLGNLEGFRDVRSKTEDILDEINKIQEKLTLFVEHKINEKLNTQVVFDQDLRKLEEIQKYELYLVLAYEESFAGVDEQFAIFKEYNSKVNNDLFEGVRQQIERYISSVKLAEKNLDIGENDILIIDQPEDDLDNQSIYKDLISQLLELKDRVQFIFATHNPNIPVLGDS